MLNFDCFYCTVQFDNVYLTFLSTSCGAATSATKWPSKVSTKPSTTLEFADPLKGGITKRRVFDYYFIFIKYCFRVLLESLAEHGKCLQDLDNNFWVIIHVV